MNILRQDSCCSTLANNQVNGFMYLDHINQLRVLIHSPYIKQHATKLAGIKLHRTLFFYLEPLEYINTVKTCINKLSCHWKAANLMHQLMYDVFFFFSWLIDLKYLVSSLQASTQQQKDGHKPCHKNSSKREQFRANRSMKENVLFCWIQWSLS